MAKDAWILVNASIMRSVTTETVHAIAPPAGLVLLVIKVVKKVSTVISV